VKLEPVAHRGGGAPACVLMPRPDVNCCSHLLDDRPTAMIGAHLTEGDVMAKCAECGYLAVRHLETQTLVGPGNHQRKTGQPPEGNGPRANLDITPVCAVGVPSLRADVGESGVPHAAAAALAMNNDRECSKFTPLIPVLTPKEHLDMAVLEWQRKCEGEDRQWRREEAKELRDFQDRTHRKQRGFQRKQHRDDLLFRTIHLITGLLQT
jgi:hypothetical protein